MNNSRSILVVDDLFPNRFLLKEIITLMGHEYNEAKNGKEAVEMLQVHDYDIVFMDIEMPVMNGIETVKHIREKFPDNKASITIIALTAHNPELFFEDYKDVRFDDILTKPYSFDRVENMISKHLEA